MTVTTGTTGTEETPLLEGRDLVQEFAVRSRGGTLDGVVQAVSNVSFTLRAGETLGIVGESGSGKSTLARAVLQSPKPKSGQVFFRGTELGTLKRSELREQMRQMQVVFQDPFQSVDPKWKVSTIVEEPLRAYRVGSSAERRRRVNEVLDLVGLEPSVFGGRRARQLSGGQCQRVAIARALTLSPSLVICDEAVSSLDVLVQAQVLNLLEQLRSELGLSYLFIAHDLALVRQVSDQVAVMYLGKLCETGPASDMFRAPAHPYTAALLASIPSADPTVERVRTDDRIGGEPPSPIDPPSGCRFHTRCPLAQERCRVEVPLMRSFGDGRNVACHFPLVDVDGSADHQVAVAADGAGPS